MRGCVSGVSGGSGGGGGVEREGVRNVKDVVCYIIMYNLK